MNDLERMQTVDQISNLERRIKRLQARQTHDVYEARDIQSEIDTCQHGITVLRQRLDS